MLSALAHSEGCVFVFAEETCKRGASRFIGVPVRSNATTGWLALFSNGNAPVCVMLTCGVAIHALSLRMVDAESFEAARLRD